MLNGFNVSIIDDLAISTAELVQVSGFKEAKFDKNLLSGLVLKRETKDLIYDLTQMYTRDSSPSQSSTPNVHKTVKLSKVHKQQSGPGQQATWSADFIEGKGECLTFLLHGKPGVGKTYTAGKLRLVHYTNACTRPPAHLYETDG